jgi:hypothetical protein
MSALAYYHEGDIRLDVGWDVRGACGIPVWSKRVWWRKQHEAWVDTLSPEERALWVLPAPLQWPH